MDTQSIKYKLLFVDDDKEVTSVNSKYFRNCGYTVSTAFNTTEVLQILNTFQPHCIILDVMLPEKDGFSAFSDIRKKSNAPIIFLTGRESEDDKIHGLMLGADDYIVKPYSLRELEARIQVVTRRYHFNEPNNQNIIDLYPLQIDIIAHKVYYDKKEINLSNKEYQFLHLLATAVGKAFTFEEIGRNLWGSYLESDRKTIMVTASRLRKKLSAYPGLENCIETIWSKGYKYTR